MDLFSKIGHGLYHDFLERWLLLASRGFICSKSTLETLKTLEQNVKCFFKLKAKTPERRQ